MGQIDWNAVSAIGQVAGAIATALAVVVSLQLARRTERAMLRMKCQLATTRPGDASNAFVSITVANIGVRPETITSIGWAGRRWRAERYFFKPSEPQSQDRLPARVQPGEHVQFAWSSMDFERCSAEIRDWCRRDRFLGLIYRRPRLFIGTAAGEECRATVSHGVYLLFAIGNLDVFLSHELRIVS
jgi:hypothetical protein